MAKKPARRTRGQPAEEPAELEVEEVAAAEPPKPAKPPAGIETWLILVTWFALGAAFVLINLKMHSAFGQGWPV